MVCEEVQEMELPSGQVLLTRCTRVAPHPPDGHDYAFKIPYTFVGGAVFRVRTNEPPAPLAWPTELGSVVGATPRDPSWGEAGEWVLIEYDRYAGRGGLWMRLGAAHMHTAGTTLRLERVVRVGVA